MSKLTIGEQIRGRIEAFLGDLGALVREAALESVQGALTHEQTGPARRGPGRPRRLGLGSDSGGRGTKRNQEVLEKLKERLFEVISANPGRRMEELGRLLEVPTRQLMLPVKKLANEQRIRTKGQKRATTYWVR